MSEYLTEIIEQASDPLGGASGQKRRFRVEFLAKSNNAEFPFTVANELVATQLGQALGLNLPTVLTYLVAGEVLVFIQMIDRNLEMTKGPPATAKALGNTCNPILRKFTPRLFSTYSSRITTKRLAQSDGT